MLSKRSISCASARLDDHELLAKYYSGDEAAFEVLLRRHKRKVWAHIYQLVKDRELAEDLFQDTWIKAVQKLKQGRYAEEGKFRSWVMRIAHNIVIDHFRLKRKMPVSRTTETFDILATIRQPGPNVEQRFVNEQVDHDVRKLIEHLPAEQREVVIMRTYLDMSFKEIAEHTDVSINTALGRMRYALLNLRKLIRENEIALERL